MFLKFILCGESKNLNLRTVFISSEALSDLAQELICQSFI